jgi:hypothetical protein
MGLRRRLCLCTTGIALCAALLAGHAAEAQDTALLKDLTAVIALLGLPCGQVVGATSVKSDDHLASCQDGNRYRVFIDAQGRVVARKLES